MNNDEYNRGWILPTGEYLAISTDHGEYIINNAPENELRLFDLGNIILGLRKEHLDLNSFLANFGGKGYDSVWWLNPGNQIVPFVASSKWVRVSDFETDYLGFQLSEEGFNSEQFKTAQELVLRFNYKTVEIFPNLENVYGAGKLLSKYDFVSSKSWLALKKRYRR